MLEMHCVVCCVLPGWQSVNVAGASKQSVADGTNCHSELSLSFGDCDLCSGFVLYSCPCRFVTPSSHHEHVSMSSREKGCSGAARIPLILY